jgi:hypothetical protein
VAVHSVLPATPVTVKVAASASEADAVGGATVPAPQVSVTVTLLALSSVKSLWTVNVPTAVLVIVQLLLPPSLMATLAQFDWLAL